MQPLKCWIFIFVLLSTTYILYTLTTVKTEDNPLPATRPTPISSTPRQSRINITVNKTSSSTNKTKNILYYYPMFEHPDFYMGTGSKLFENCSYKNCYIDHNKEYLPMDEWDALLFHMPEHKHWTQPTERSAKQRYIFYSLESPIHTHNRLSDFKNFFNWTMTYRLDSDVYRPYGLLHTKKTGYKPPTVEQLAGKSKKIAWFVSNCYVNSKRNALARAINASIPVDVYGRCGPLSCTGEKECRQMVENDYKFYLSFENSICKDYLTEKTLRMLDYNVIPIVYSGADLAPVTPPHSVINVQNFSTVSELVDYIKFLDNNPDEYLKYFKWKKDFVYDNRDTVGLCDLCKKLHENVENKVYSDIEGWWYGKEEKYCSNSFIDKFLKT